MSNKLYTSIPAPKVPRNNFDRSRPNSLTLQFQRVCPTMVEEILPGDLFRVGTETFARLQPLIAPVMNNMKISQHFFFVPLRTLNKHFAEFMFNNRTGDYSEVLPYTTTAQIYGMIDTLSDEGDDILAAECIRLFDYIGLPFKYSSAVSASAFVSAWLADTWNIAVSESAKRVNLAPFFAYQKIWSEYFRDENVEEDPFVVFEDLASESVFDWTGNVTSKLTNVVVDFCSCFFRLRPRAWAHDRFTSSLPFAQRGPDVLLPIAGTAEVKYKDGYLLEQRENYAQAVVLGAGQTPSENKAQLAWGSLANGQARVFRSEQTGYNASANVAAFDPNGSLYTDFDDASLTTTINAFRRAERLQRWYENSARGGVRPNEATLAHFGVRTPDATLDRAEFLGGSMQPIVVSEVAQTSQTTSGEGGSPQGTLAGKGTSYKGQFAFKSFFTEHGFVFCFTSALVRANYWQGIPKVFSRMQRDEYYWPEFANLGEEPVFTKELYAPTQNEDDVFGYVPRYSDYKSAVGEVHGDMRSSLAFWTQAREFSNTPRLNKEFLFGDAPLTPFAVQSQYTDPIIATIQFSVKASRLMPFYGVPTI